MLYKMTLVPWFSYIWDLILWFQSIIFGYGILIKCFVTENRKTNIILMHKPISNKIQLTLKNQMPITHCKKSEIYFNHRILYFVHQVAQCLCFQNVQWPPQTYITHLCQSQNKTSRFNSLWPFTIPFSNYLAQNYKKNLNDLLGKRALYKIPTMKEVITMLYTNIHLR